MTSETNNIGRRAGRRTEYSFVYFILCVLAIYGRPCYHFVTIPIKKSFEINSVFDLRLTQPNDNHDYPPINEIVDDCFPCRKMWVEVKCKSLIQREYRLVAFRQTTVDGNYTVHLIFMNIWLSIPKLTSSLCLPPTSMRSVHLLRQSFDFISRMNLFASSFVSLLHWCAADPVVWARFAYSVCDVRVSVAHVFPSFCDR